LMAAWLSLTRSPMSIVQQH